MHLNLGTQAQPGEVKRNKSPLGRLIHPVQLAGLLSIKLFLSPLLSGCSFGLGVTVLKPHNLPAWRCDLQCTLPATTSAVEIQAVTSHPDAVPKFQQVSTGQS